MVSSVGKMTSKKVLLTPKQKFDSLLIESVKAYPELYNNSRANRDPFWNQIYTDMKNCNIGYGNHFLYHKKLIKSFLIP